MARPDDLIPGDRSAGKEGRRKTAGERPAAGGVPPRTVAEARAAAETQRTERREAREKRLEDAFAGPLPGRGIVVCTWASTILLAIVSLVSLMSSAALEAFFVVTFSMFGLGALMLAVDVVFAAERSTRDSMGIGGIFFLADAAPGKVQRWMNGSLGAAVAVSIVTAVVGLSKPELAFGTLAPLLQLSLSGLWGVRHGLFVEREDTSGAD